MYGRNLTIVQQECSKCEAGVQQVCGKSVTTVQQEFNNYAAGM